jgi:hypothetical protein
MIIDEWNEFFKWLFYNRLSLFFIWCDCYDLSILKTANMFQYINLNYA